ncbi:antibiotic biosynthesis monooxygenase family protein [Umezawaea tangerina]|uniref:Antibiotic biosynthesis monooxygenase n=1 Tax=Umezawaea tangerina TaxID=84725 RepID=A0A2T0SZ26_9PSEU|nr:antibiotic biosynthesis monooxygenase [Umezawaea tangerina]PRY38668.1 antibiotic biosynthesis monooxygenase [Umezawaea tangerina]
MADNAEPLVLINLFSMPKEVVDRFIDGWENSTAAAKDAKGFRGTRLHRSLDPDAEFPVVNIARWDSVEEWQEAVGRYFSAPAKGDRGPVSAKPGLYTVVHVTPDPRESAVHG